MELLVKDENSNNRLDKFIAEKTDLSRNFIKKKIEDSKILLNNKTCKPSVKLKSGDVIFIPDIKEPVDINLKPENIELDIIYEDSDILVVNKPSGILTHPSGKTVTGTLVNRLLYHYSSLSTVYGEFRPGIVHRLDKDTSGIILITKNNRIHNKISEQFKNREIKKIYLAVVTGQFNEEFGYINLPIGRGRIKRRDMIIKYDGRESVTMFRVLKQNNGLSFLQVQPVTGRTHQIRVHLKHTGHPVAGDKNYRGSNMYNNRKMMLHAFKIFFFHPGLNKESVYTAPLPDHFTEFLVETGLDMDLTKLDYFTFPGRKSS